MIGMTKNRTTETQKMLLVQDNLGTARALQEMVAGGQPARFEVVHVDRLAEAQRYLVEEQFDIILLDLSLPDVSGIETLIRLHDAARDTPIVVLSDREDEALALKTVQAGAQDHLLTPELERGSLLRALRYAIERHNRLAELRTMSLIDDTTELYNRRGFLTLAQQQIKLANRTQRNLMLLFADLDGLKLINDSFGHSEGTRALMETAQILREIFRSSDIIARIGGDEFVVMVVETCGLSIDVIVQRFEEQVRRHNVLHDRPYRLSISVGAACYNPDEPCSIDELLSRADLRMYEHKRSKRRIERAN
jgi:two-component system cell cycle response regulator